MGARAKAIVPLAIVIGVLSFLWTELSLNFMFHWVANDLPAAAGIGAYVPHWQSFNNWNQASPNNLGTLPLLQVNDIEIIQTAPPFSPAPRATRSIRCRGRPRW